MLFTTVHSNAGEHNSFICVCVGTVGRKNGLNARNKFQEKIFGNVLDCSETRNFHRLIL